MEPTSQPKPELRYYAQVLEAELQRRKAKNPRYSLRAFAANPDLHPSALSRVLTGKQDLSLQSAALVLKKLTLDPTERDCFMLSIAEEKYRRAMMLLSDGSHGGTMAWNEAETERRKYRALLDILPVMACILTTELEFDYANLPYRKFLAFDPVACDSSSEWRAMVHPDDVPAVETTLAEGQRSGSAFEIVCRHGPRGGPYQPVRVSHSPFHDESQKIAGWLSTIIPLT